MSGRFNETPAHDDASLKLNASQKIPVILALVAILGVTYYAYALFLPRYEEPFISLSILGDTQSLERYYPNDDPTLGVNIPLSWYLRLFNNKPESQNILINVKMLNETQTSPNSTLCLPSPVPASIGLPITLEHNETLTYPFFWSISKVEYLEDNVLITEMTANNLTVPLHTSSVNGNGFRLIFELWIYDSSVDEYTFIQSAVTDRCVWNQIWFNIIAS